MSDSERNGIQMPDKWHSRWRKFYSAVSVLVLLAISALVAARWPISGHKIQAQFFESLASSLLTLLGIVFTLCLIGTQVTATRTNISIRRTFGVGAWLYLIFFVVATLWTFAISYRAGDVEKSTRLCQEVRNIRFCITEGLAGRLSIFGLVCSLIFLPPFVIYIYRRLTTSYSFHSLAKSALRARNMRRLTRRSNLLCREIISVSSDPSAVADGLDRLLQVAVIGSSSRRFRKKVPPIQFATAITRDFARLNEDLTETPLVSLYLSRFKDWMVWVIEQASTSSNSGSQSLGNRQIANLIRIALNCAEANFRSWTEADGSSTSARDSLALLQAIVDSCRARPVRLRLASIANQLAESATTKSVEGTRGDFNLALRGVIALTEKLALPEYDGPNAWPTLNALTQAIVGIGARNPERHNIPKWVLAELHDLTNDLSYIRDITPKQWKTYTSNLCNLADSEILGLLVNRDGARQVRVGEHRSWQLEIIQLLRESGRQNLIVRAVNRSCGQWFKENDLIALMSAHEMMTDEYLFTGTQEAADMLIHISAHIRKYFASHA